MRHWVRLISKGGVAAAGREKMKDIATIEGGLELLSLRKASDGTTKMVFRLKHGPGAGGQVGDGSQTRRVWGCPGVRERVPALMRTR